MIDRFFSLFSHDIGIDLGTANTLVWVRGKGIVIREPSVVAMHKKSKQVIAIGTEAKKMIGKTPAVLTTVRPLKDGVISDFDATTAMLNHYIQKVHEIGKIPAMWARPKVVIGIPSAVTEVERRAVWESALSAGAREAYLIEEPMAAAIGEGVSVFQPTGVMVVDIGGGTTEVAIISLGGIVVNRSLKIAGDEMTQAIIHYIRLRHGLLLGESTAEDIKIKIGSVHEGRSIPIKSGSKIKKERETEKKKGKTKESDADAPADSEVVEIVEEKQEEKMAVVRGRDLETGLPKSLKVTATEVREALSSIAQEIVEGIVDVLEEAPPELTSDILEHGILLTGGGALLSGMDRLIVERTHMSVIIADDPLVSVVKGTGKVLEDASLLSRVKVTGGLR